MNDEENPVLPEEFILRRIPLVFYNGLLVPPITTQAFRPRDDELDGLSFYRERFISAFELAQAMRVPGKCYVARLLASEFMKYPLTLKPDPQPHPAPKGHIIIPELAFPIYIKNKTLHKDWHDEFAKLFSKDIVYSPPTE